MVNGFSRILVKEEGLSQLTEKEKLERWSPRIDIEIRGIQQ